MTDDKRKGRISDNPSVQEISKVLPALKLVRFATRIAQRLGFKSESLERIRTTVDDALAGEDVLTLPDRFNDAFAPKGWIATNAMAADTMNEAVELAAGGHEEAAEEKILEWFTEDNIRLFAITRAQRFHKARGRYDQLEEALSLYLEERYISAVPLILIACDGLASDVSGTSPFEKNADLSAFDSITGHETSLPALIDLVRKGVRKSSDEELCLPLRHGILHGRSLGYANKIVSAKAWLLMVALVDWAIDKSSEDERRRKRDENDSVTLRDLGRKLRKNEEDKRAIEAFEPIEKNGPFESELDEASPEYAFKEFLSGWQAGNFGRMGKHAVNLTAKPINQMAGEMRNICQFVELVSFNIRSVKQSTVARSEALVYVTAKTLTNEVDGMFELLAFRNTTDGDIAMPTDDGIWSVQQLCVYNVMHGKTVEANSK